MDMFDEAQALAGMIHMLSLTQDEVAVRLGVSQSYIANKLRLLRLSPRVREKIREHSLSERHARAILRLPSEENALSMIERIARDSLTVQSTEQLVDALLSAKGDEGVIETVTLIERVVYSYLDTIHNLGVRIKKTVEEKDGVATLTFMLEAR